MAHTTHSRDFGLCGDRTVPLANGIGRSSRDGPTSDRRPSPCSARALSPGRLPACWRPPADTSRTAWSAKSCRSFWGPTGACHSSLVQPQTQPLVARFHADGPVPLYDRFVEPAPHAHANESAPTRVIRSSACCEGSDCRTFALALRPALSSDGDALQ